MRYILIVLLFASFSSSAQSHFNEQWVYGNFGHFQLNFEPMRTETGFINNNLASEYFMDGHSNICDSNGQLLLLCNGFKLFDSLGQLVQGGGQLVDNGFYNSTSAHASSYSQSSIILPMGGGIYYVIVGNATDTTYAKWGNVPFSLVEHYDELIFYKVDISANAGLPKVIDTIKRLQGEQLSKTMMMACKHANGQDWWLIKQRRDSSGQFRGIYPQPKNSISKLFVSKDSIGPALYQDFPNTFMDAFDMSGQAMFNCKGTKYAVTSRGLNKIFIADFDRNTAQLSNPQFIDVPNPSRQMPQDTTLLDSLTNGLCWSPNGQFIYVAKFFNIMQYDLLDSNPATQWQRIHGVDTVFNKFEGYNSIYPGPDNKLYIGYFGGLSKTTSYIDSPSKKGAACAFREKGLNFGATATLGAGINSPPCMPYYDMDLVPCDTSVSSWAVGLSNVFASELDLRLYPNPTFNTLHVQINDRYTNYQYELLSIEGKRVQSGVLTPSINMSSLHSGVYVLRVYNAQGSMSRRVIKD